MPLVEKSDYSATWFFRNGHIQSIYPTLCRRLETCDYRRERITLSDGDFLDLDWLRQDEEAEHLAIICHGLESSSSAHYVRGMASALYGGAIDVLCLNFRGCSGEPNRLLRSYHSGATEDLRTVIAHAKKRGRYRRISLVGFSLGGNLILKYLGEGDVEPLVSEAVAVSVPCDLKSSALALAKGFNRIYMRRFIRLLVEKLETKNRLLNAGFDLDEFRQMTNFAQFDSAYTAPQHGFASAEDYWSKCSARNFIDEINIPTLIINAADDPFLAEECYPRAEARRSEYVFLEVPEHGGHVGFVPKNQRNAYYFETRALEFLRQE